MRVLLRHFSTFTRLPIQINDIVDCILERGLQDEITFHSVDIDPTILKGQIHQFTYQRIPFGDPVRATQILYSGLLPFEWQRFVCAKELAHLLDRPHEMVANQEEVERLISEVILPLDVQSIERLAPHTVADHVAVLRAILLLLPLEAREHLLSPFKQGVVDTAKVAALAQIPEHYVQIAMSDSWPDVVCRLTNVEPGDL